MILRVSQKLNKKIGAGVLDAVPMDANPYADWSAHLFTADRTQYVIVSNTASLYSCVMYGRGISDDSRFIERALSTLREFMEDDGLSAIYHQWIAPAGEIVQFAKALNRSVIGSMNDLVLGAKMDLIDDLAPPEVGFRLNETPLSLLGYADPRSKFTSFGNNVQAGEGANG